MLYWNVLILKYLYLALSTLFFLKTYIKFIITFPPLCILWNNFFSCGNPVLTNNFKIVCSKSIVSCSIWDNTEMPVWCGTKAMLIHIQDDQHNLLTCFATQRIQPSQTHLANTFLPKQSHMLSLTHPILNEKVIWEDSLLLSHMFCVQGTQLNDFAGTPRLFKHILV